MDTSPRPDPFPGFTPEQRTAVHRYRVAASWSSTAVAHLRACGRQIDSERTLTDVLRTIDADALGMLLEDLRATCDRANEERDRLAAHTASCSGCRDCDPAGEVHREAAAEARRAAEFRASPAGRQERVIELLESIDAKLSGGAR